MRLETPRSSQNPAKKRLAQYPKNICIRNQESQKEPSEPPPTNPFQNATFHGQKSSDIQTVHAIAMHGTPKYAKGFKYFDYVNPNAPKKGHIDLGAFGTFDSLNGFITKGNPAEGLALTYDTLLKSAEDEAFSEYGLLAKSMILPKDRAWVIFHLRKEAKWHDGSPITPKDIIFSMNILKKEGAPFFKQYYKDVIKVEKVGSHAVKFTFKNARNKELPLIETPRLAELIELMKMDRQTRLDFMRDFPGSLASAQPSMVRKS